MDKVKDALHIRRKSKPDNSDNTTGASGSPIAQHVEDEHTRASIDSELAAMPADEREAYLKEFEEADRTGEPKKGSLIDKLIARGNKKTEDQIAQESLDRQKQPMKGSDGVIR